MSLYGTGFIKFLNIFYMMLKYNYFSSTAVLPCLPSLLYGVFKSRGNEANCWAYPSDEVTGLLTRPTAGPIRLMR
jgi:hypothetical protein